MLNELIQAPDIILKQSLSLGSANGTDTGDSPGWQSVTHSSCSCMYTCSYSTRESGRLPAEVMCGENDAWCQVRGVKGCVGSRWMLTCSGACTHTHTHTQDQPSPLWTLTLSHTSHVPRCEKKGGKSTSSQITSEASRGFLFMCSESERRSLIQLRRAGRTLSVTRPRWKSHGVKGSK